MLKRPQNHQFEIEANISRRNPTEPILLILGISLSLSMVLLIFITGIKRSKLSFELLFFLPFLVYFASIFLLRRYYSPESRFFLPLILIFAVLLQGMLLLTDVTLSDDIYRFFTEGKAISKGIDPYTTPISEYPSELKDRNAELANHQETTSPYPPVALLMFLIFYLLYPSTMTFRIFFSLGFLSSIIVCYKLLERKSRWKLIIYAWNPLLHLETANGSHFEAIVVLAVMLAIYAIQREKPAIAGTAFLIAFLLKYYPIFLVVVYWKHLGKRGMSVFLAGLSIYGFLIMLHPSAIMGLISFGEEHYFNASIFWVLVQLLKNFSLAKLIVGLVLVYIMVNLAFKSREETEFSASQGLIAIGLLLLLQPVFHPWYVFWIFPFLILDDELNLSWVVLTGTLIFSYNAYIAFDTTMVWKESNFIRFIEFFPFFAILLIEKRKDLLEIFYRLKFRLKNRTLATHEKLGNLTNLYRKKAKMGATRTSPDT